MVKAIYTIRGTDTCYRVLKCDSDFENWQTYVIEPDWKEGHFRCKCPSSEQPCKHLKMLMLFKDAEAVNTGKFYDYEARRWVKGPKVVTKYHRR